MLPKGWAETQLDEFIEFHTGKASDQEKIRVSRLDYGLYDIEKDSSNFRKENHDL